MNDDRVILLWGLHLDGPLAAVYQELQAKGHPVVLLDQHKVADTRIDLLLSPGAGENNGVSGELVYDGVTYDLTAVRSFYQRPYDYADIPAVAKAGAESPLGHHASEVEDRLSIWADLTPSLVINRPASMFANSSKPFQTAWLASLGFDVPETLVTTDPASAMYFWKEHGNVIYKSVGGTRSIVSRLTPEHEERLENLASCPTQFQQYIPGIEHRVHVVGDEVFACSILCDADDYRYSPEPAKLSASELPALIAELCRTVASAMKLPLAGLDLRCTPEGRWYCFEVNPSPGFSFFDVNTNPSIAEAVANLLVSGTPRH